MADKNKIEDKSKIKDEERKKVALKAIEEIASLVEPRFPYIASCLYGVTTSITMKIEKELAHLIFEWTLVNLPEDKLPAIYKTAGHA